MGGRLTAPAHRRNSEQETAARTVMNVMKGLTPGNPGFICREVVVEVAWVLERSYRSGDPGSPTH